MPAKKTYKRKTRRPGTPRAVLSRDVLGKRGVGRVKAEIKATSKTWTRVHFVALYLNYAHVLRGAYRFLINTGLVRSATNTAHLPLTSPCARVIIPLPAPINGIVHRTVIQGDLPPLPVGTGQPYTEFDSRYGERLLQIIQEDPGSVPLGGGQQQYSDQLSATYQHIVRPNLYSDANAPIFPNLAQAQQLRCKIDLEEYCSPTRQQNWRMLQRSQAPLLMGEVKGFYTSNFGKALEKVLEKESKSFGLEDDDRKKVLERLIVYTQPIYVANLHANVAPIQYRWNTGHPVFLDDNQNIIGQMPVPQRQEILNQIMPILSLLIWMVDPVRPRLKTIPDAPNPIPATLSSARFGVKRFGQDWQSLMKANTCLYEAAAVSMVYLSERYVQLSVTEDDEIPENFDPIEIAPRKTSLITEPVLLNYEVFRGVIIAAVQHPYHQYPALRKNVLEIALPSGRIAIPPLSASAQTQVAYMSRFCSTLHADGSYKEAFPSLSAVSYHQGRLVYWKSRQPLAITKLAFRSDGVKTFQISFEWKPSDAQVQAHPEVAVANRIASYEELTSASNHYQDMPSPNHPYPGTNSTGSLTRLQNNPRLPAQQFLDDPTAGASKTIGVDSGQTFLIHATDRNARRTREEFAITMDHINHELHNGGIDAHEHSEAAREAKQEFRSHTRTITGAFAAEQCLTARDERIEARVRSVDQKKADLRAMRGQEGPPAYNDRVDDLRVAPQAVTTGGLKSFSEFFSLHSSHFTAMAAFENLKSSSRKFDRSTAKERFFDKAARFTSFNLSKRELLTEGEPLVLSNKSRKRRWRKRERLRRAERAEGKVLVPGPPKTVLEPALMFWGSDAGNAAKGRRPMSSKELARTAAIIGNTVVATPEFDSTKTCVTSNPSCDFHLPAPDPLGPPNERSSGLTPHYNVTIQTLQGICPDGHKIVYGRPSGSGNHGKRACCLMPDDRLRPLSKHKKRIMKETNRLVGCTSCPSFDNPAPRIFDPAFDYEVRPTFPPTPLPVVPPPLQSLTHRDHASANIRDIGISYIRSGGQRPAHNVHPASLAHIRAQETPWQHQIRIRGPIPHVPPLSYDNHLHRRSRL